MIQDKIFFDEKNPTGLSYNTPFTVYGSYQGRLWSKTPNGSIEYYAQIGDLSVYATTGSNQFKSSQAITGSLTVTGQVIAQTLNVQQVTSSIVFSSGSNRFGNNLSNRQQFTGSLQVSGSSHYVLGNVGINTITPQTPLQILRDTTGNGTSIEESNMAFTVLSAAGQSKISIGASNAGNYGYVQVMQDATSWTNRNLVLQPRGGNVGIGTYSPLSFANTLTVHMNGGSNGSFFTMAGSGTRYLTILAQSGEGKIETNTAIPLILATNEIERLRITSGGNTEVRSGNILNIYRTDNTRALQLSTTSNECLIDAWAASSEPLMLRSNGAGGRIVFHTNGGERVRITSDGNVGIGTTTINSERLTVVQTTGNASALYVYTSGVTTGQSYGLTVVAGTNSSDRTFAVFNQAGNTEYLKVRGDGKLYSAPTYGNAVGSPRSLYIDSDGCFGGLISIRASKTNIQSLDTNWLYNLNPVQFNYRKKNKNEQFTDEFDDELFYGLIAEETELINKELCNYNNEVLIGIEYSKLVPVLVKAVQELKSENDNLKSILQRNNIV